jgi:hypothetical protein
MALAFSRALAAVNTGTFCSASPRPRSTPLCNEPANFLRTRKNHVGTVPHHSGWHEGRRASAGAPPWKKCRMPPARITRIHPFFDIARPFHLTPWNGANALNNSVPNVTSDLGSSA